ncbi:hypothetical protein [Pseudomonas sp. FEN]|nr:hypothetical protein [Pseudomonas sp. FEN]
MEIVSLLQEAIKEKIKEVSCKKAKNKKKKANTNYYYSP